MNKSSLLKPVLLISASTLLFSGCVTREVVYRDRPPVVVQQPVPPGTPVPAEPAPPPIVEVVPVAPDPAYIWVPGIWIWRGHWVWERGHWGGHRRYYRHW